MTRLAGDARAATSVLVACALPMLMGVAALAVDLGMVQLEARRMQGMADASALAAARDLAAAEAGARGMVAANAAGEEIAVDAVLGRYAPDPDVAPDARFVAGASDADAVRVTLSRDVPTAFARVFGVDHIRVARHATAARLDMASLSIGSRLASVDGGVLNALLSQLTGSSVSLNVMDYNALASAQIDLLPFLGALRTRANVGVGTYDELLATEVSGNALIAAVADQVADPAARAALMAIAAAAQGTTRLDRLIDLGAIGAQSGGGSGLVRVNALELVTNLLQQTSRRRQLELDLGATIPGLASTRATVAIGERPNQSPWIAVTRSRDVIVRTAQARIYIETELAPSPLGLKLVSIRLPLFVELASAEAKLEALRCGNPNMVDVAARPSPGLLAIAEVDRTRLQDFTTPLARSPAQLFRIPLVIRLMGSATVDLGTAEPWRTLTFDAAMIDAGTPHTIASTRLTSGVAASLISTIDLDPRLELLPLPLPLNGLLSTVGGALGAVTPALDAVIATITGALGLQVGAADVRVTGLRCGEPALVQ